MPVLSIPFSFYFLSNRYNVDGIITTNPTGLIKIMKEEGYRDEYRLATSKDDPFKVIHVTNF